MVEIWTKHVSGAHRSPQMMFLIDQMGPEGYGINWILAEILMEQPNHRYPLSLVPALARQINTTPAKIEAVIMGYSLFNIDDEAFFFSPSLDQALIPFHEKRKEHQIKGQLSAAKKKIKLKKQEEEIRKLLSESNSSEQKNALVELSRDDSSKQIREEKRREEKKKKDSLKSRRSFISFIREHFVNEDIYTATKNGEVLQVVSVDQNGTLYDKMSTEKIHASRSNDMWTKLYELALNDKLMCFKQQKLF